MHSAKHMHKGLPGGRPRHQPQARRRAGHGRDLTSGSSKFWRMRLLCMCFRMRLRFAAAWAAMRSTMREKLRHQDTSSNAVRRFTMHLAASQREMAPCVLA